MKNRVDKTREYLYLLSSYPLDALGAKIKLLLNSRFLKQRQCLLEDQKKKEPGGQTLSYRVDCRAITASIKSSRVKEIIMNEGEKASLHIFDLLGSGPVRVAENDISREKRLKNEMKKLLAVDNLDADHAFTNYRAVDWHVDFKSGFRWDPDIRYSNPAGGRFPGADIKVPWELSRFHQAAALGLSANIDKDQDKKNDHWGKEFVFQVTDWIISNPYPCGVNWASTMDVAIRAINWLWGWVLLKEAPFLNGQFNALIIRSLYQHACHIEHHLEFLKRGFHGNHYLSNLAGLIYIGAFLPGFPESDRWLAFGLQEMIEEMKHQVYDDGICFEGSTSYHRLVAEIFFSCTAVVLNLSPERRQSLTAYDHTDHRVKPRLFPYKQQEYNLESDKIFPGWYWAKLELMAEFIFNITKPQGKVPQFGDNDNGRMHKFTPVINEKGEEEFNDHRHVLAVAGKLFGREDFLTGAARYMLDAELLLGRVKFLPLSTGKHRQAVLNSSKPAGQSGVERKAGISSEIKISFGEGRKDFTIKSPSRLVYYPKGGIAVYKSDLYYLAVNCAPGGLGGIGAHNHNDKLSLELNILGHDFIVDGGSYVYNPFPELRNAFRSTWAHNTVAVKGKEQSRILQRFLFALPDRSRATVSAVDEKRYVGAHRGFGFSHRREMLIDPDQVVIKDYLGKKCEAYFILNLHPDVVIEREDDQSVGLNNNGVMITITGWNVKYLTIQPGFYSVKYGKRVANQRLLIPIHL